jgi:outer membrane protein assembly factor BamD (BamD/ComL family)
MTYMNLIGDNKLAIASLEEYVKRFPKNTYTAISLYYLYKLYDKEQNFAKADSYKAQVIKQYPQSNYAKVLTNPDFQKDIKAQEKQVEKMYADAYRSYVRGDYETVIRLAHDQTRKFPDTYLASQFQFLCAMSEGRMADIQALKASLENFVKQYPKEENTPLAQSILTYIANNDSAHIANMMTAHLAHTMPSDTTDTTAIAHNVPEEEKELFSLETNPPFFYVLAVKSEFVDINQVKFNAINYNLDYFTNFDFDVQTKELTAKISLLVISPFESQGQAMNYFDLINYNQEIFEGIEKVFTNHFIISEQNYQALLSNKDVEAYMKFFDENYEQR